MALTSGTITKAWEVKEKLKLLFPEFSDEDLNDIVAQILEKADRKE